MSVPCYAGLCIVAVACWLALYRLPFGDATRRRRLALRLADHTGMRPDPAFAIFGTLLYLSLGTCALTVLAALSPLTLHEVAGTPSAADLPALLLAVFGTSSLNICCVSVLYRMNTAVDVPGEIARIQWISSILPLPRHYRWVVPALAAMLEELVFRGAVLLGLGSLGSGFAVAAGFSTCLFAAGQIALVSTRVQAYVLGTSSLTIGAVGSLLVAATGSILPAVALHMSFAGFYTNLSAASGPRVPPASRRLGS